MIEMTLFRVCVVILSFFTILQVYSIEVIIRDGGIPKEYHQDPPKSDLLYAKISGDVAGINNFDEKGYTPLMRAAMVGNLDALKSYIATGGNVSLPNKDGDTPVFFSAKNGFYLTTLELINAGADINKPNIHGLTPFLLAIIGGYYETTEMMLDNGADPTTALPNGITALMIASQKGLIKIMQLLLSRNVPINVQTLDGGSTALMFACTSSYLPAVQTLLGTLAPTQKLSFETTHGISTTPRQILELNKQDFQGFTALAMAAFRGSTDIVQALLDANAEINLKDHLDRLPIHHAIEGSHEEVIDLLVEYGSELPRSGFYRNPMAMQAREARRLQQEQQARIKKMRIEM